MNIDDIGLDATVMADRFGHVQSFNGAAQMLFGYTAAEVIGRDLNYLFPETNQELSVLRLYNLAADLDTGELRGVGRRREVAGLRKDGSKIAVELSIVDGWGSTGLRRLTCVMHDVTERNLQAREWQYATKLATHAAELADRARLEAEAANRAKTEFLAVMSHEIRTPMTSISGFVDLLAGTSGLTTQQRRYVELVRTANAALLAVVDEILDFSKVEAGQIELECSPFSLLTLIQDAVDFVRPLALAKHLPIEQIIDHDMPVWLIGDHARLRQVLLNLLNNAIKFTETGAITLDARPYTFSDGRKGFRFSLTDTGIGIPAVEQHRLFKAFSQADSSVSRRHGGTGLGLAICKHLVELMGGEIGIMSDVDQGTTVWFTVSLPVAAQPGSDPTVLHQPQVYGRISDILDFSKVEAGQLELECSPFSLSTLIQDAVDFVRPLALAKHLPIEHKIDHDMPVWLIGDHAPLRQVLVTLLDNAIKFTETGAITLDARPYTFSDGRKGFRFSLTDTGIGIPADEQHRLFEVFSKADSSVSRQHGGTGLGLAICKHLVELMGGEIGIMSDVDQGTTVWFTVSLPVSAQPGSDSTVLHQPQVYDRKSAQTPNGDDIVDDPEIFETYLVEEGYDFSPDMTGF